MRFLFDKLTEEELDKQWNWQNCRRRIAYVSMAELIIVVLVLGTAIVVVPKFYSSENRPAVQQLRSPMKPSGGACHDISGAKIRSL
jgi:hypothetical protein